MVRKSHSCWAGDFKSGLLSFSQKGIGTGGNFLGGGEDCPGGNCPVSGKKCIISN